MTPLILIVDDHIGVLRTIVRALGGYVVKLRTASTPEEAEAVLREEPVTHLLCDHNLGEGVPTGTQLIPRWRALYPSIERALIFTGSQADSITLPPEVDQLLKKPAGKKELIEAFGLRGHFSTYG